MSTVKEWFRVLFAKVTPIYKAGDSSDISYYRPMRGALRDLVPFVKFKKRGKQPWRSVNFRKVAG